MRINALNILIHAISVRKYIHILLYTFFRCYYDFSPFKCYDLFLYNK